MPESIEPRRQHEQNMNKKYSVKFNFGVQLFTIVIVSIKMGNDRLLECRSTLIIMLM